MTYTTVRAAVLSVLFAFPLAGVSAPLSGELHSADIAKVAQASTPGMPASILQKQKKPTGGVTMEIATPGMPAPILQKKPGSGVTMEIATPGMPAPILQKKPTGGVTMESVS